MKLKLLAMLVVLMFTCTNVFAQSDEATIANLQNQIDTLHNPDNLITPIYSGRCSRQNEMSGPLAAKICLDTENFNTAQKYISVDPSGDITILVPGFYSIRGSINGAEELIINGVSAGQKVAPEEIRPFWVDDVFYWQIPYLEYKDNYSVKDLIQIEYVGAHPFPNPSGSELDNLESQTPIDTYAYVEPPAEVVASPAPAVEVVASGESVFDPHGDPETDLERIPHYFNGGEMSDAETPLDIIKFYAVIKNRYGEPIENAWIRIWGKVDFMDSEFIVPTGSENSKYDRGVTDMKEMLMLSDEHGRVEGEAMVLPDLPSGNITVYMEYAGRLATSTVMKAGLQLQIQKRHENPSYYVRPEEN